MNPRFFSERSIELLDFDPGEVVDQLFNHPSSIFPRRTFQRLGDRLNRHLARETVDAISVLQLGRKPAAVRVERRKVVLAQNEERPNPGVMEHFSQLLEESALHVNVNRVDAQDLFKLIEEDKRIAFARAAGGILR